MYPEEIEGSTILLVDDKPENLDVLIVHLGQFGFRLLVARSGEEAFRRIKQVRPDIILLDIMMPGIDGFETCRRLKANEDTKEIPVIFMTALSNTNDKVKGFELGAVDYVTKPFQPKEVLARIKTQLTIQKLQRELNKTIVRRSKIEMEDLRFSITRTMPHEFRTPLNSILLSADSIVNYSHTMNKEDIVERARSISESAGRLHELILNYLMYAQLEVIATDPDRISKLRKGRTANLNGLITDIASIKAERTKRESDLILELDPSTTIEAKEGENQVDFVRRLINAPSTTIQMSEEHLTKIIAELVDNAFKFSEAETSVRIKTTVTEHTFIIQISDDGRGMSSEQIANIGAYMQFEREFYEQQGSGLGLTISKRLVELYDGTFEIESDADKGTTITITLSLIGKI